MASAATCSAEFHTVEAFGNSESLLLVELDSLNSWFGSSIRVKRDMVSCCSGEPKKNQRTKT